MAARRRDHRSIGDVLALLQDEFPDVTISKIRFLESQGLIEPERTPSGYRKFFEADVERLRWVLHQQKTHFLPLKVIKDRLDAIDAAGGDLSLDDGAATAAGTEPGRSQPALDLGEAATAARSPARGGRRPGGVVAAPAVDVPIAVDEGAGDDLSAGVSGVSLTREELGRAAGLDAAQIGDLEAYGLVVPAARAGDRVVFDDDALTVARLAAAFFRRGIEARHLRMYLTFAEREATLFGQVLVGHLRQRNPEARARAREELAELAGWGRALRTAFLRRSAAELLSE